MKALVYSLTLLLSVSLMSGCSQNQYAQQEYDDMYYTAQDRQKAVEEEQTRLEARRQAQLEQQRQREAALAERKRSAYDKNDAQTAREINPDNATSYTEEYTDDYYQEDTGEYYSTAPANGSGTTINNYYGGANAYNPWRNDPYWYNARPGWASFLS